MISRRNLVRGAAGAAAACALPGLHAQATVDWPTAPVRIIVPFPGGAADALTRLMAEKLQTRLGQSFFVEPRSGAGGNIAMEAGKAAAADGYTLVSATIGTLSINQFLFPKLSYDPAQDFAYASTFWENCNVFVVAAGHPAKTVREFVDWAKAQSKGVSFGSAGIGTTPHLAGDLFRVRTGIKAVHIPFRGAAQSIPALVAGETDFAIDNIASYTSLIKAGRVRVLAVTAAERWPTFPEVPTMAEAGIRDFVITSWGALVMPKATPAAIVAKLSAAMQAIAKEPETQQRFLDIGARLTASTPSETAAFAERERGKWKEIVRISGAKME